MIPTRLKLLMIYNIRKAATADARSAAVTGQSMYCPVTRRFIVIRFMNMKVYCQRVITVIAGLSGFRDRDPFAGAWKHSDCKVTGLEVQQCPEELGSVTRILKN